jgi:hypothetical protein
MATRKIDLSAAQSKSDLEMQQKRERVQRLLAAQMPPVLAALFVSLEPDAEDDSNEDARGACAARDTLRRNTPVSS